LLPIDPIDASSVIIGNALFLGNYLLFLKLDYFLLTLLIVQGIDKNLVLEIEVPLKSSCILVAVLAVDKFALAVHLRFSPQSLVTMSDCPFVLALTFHVITLVRSQISGAVSECGFAVIAMFLVAVPAPLISGQHSVFILRP
jgi:hypothetical protein